MTPNSLLVAGKTGSWGEGNEHCSLNTSLQIIKKPLPHFRQYRDILFSTFSHLNPPAAESKKSLFKVPPDRYAVGSKQDRVVTSYQTADWGLKLGEISALSTLMWYSANTYQSCGAVLWDFKFFKSWKVPLWGLLSEDWSLFNAPSCCSGNFLSYYSLQKTLLTVVSLVSLVFSSPNSTDLSRYSKCLQMVV